MKLKIVHTKHQSGNWYYNIYELRFFFFWILCLGPFNTLKEAEESAIEILEVEKIRIKTEKEPPVYYSLSGDTIVRSESDF